MRMFIAFAAHEQCDYYSIVVFVWDAKNNKDFNNFASFIVLTLVHLIITNRQMTKMR